MNSLLGKVLTSFGLVVRATSWPAVFQKLHALFGEYVQSPYRIRFPQQHTGKDRLWAMIKMQSAECLKEMCCEISLKPNQEVHMSETLPRSWPKMKGYNGFATWF